jgi:hypothetical protein
MIKAWVMKKKEEYERKNRKILKTEQQTEREEEDND